MRTYCISMAVLFSALFCLAQNPANYGKSRYTIFAGTTAQQASGTTVISRTSTVLTNLIASLGSRVSSIVIDDGKWAVTGNVTFPSNVMVSFQAGAWLNATSAVTVTFHGGFESAENQQIFSSSNMTVIYEGTIVSNPAWWGNLGDSVVLRVGPNTVSSNQIVDGSISGADIANNAIASNHIGTGVVYSSHIADRTITSNDISIGGINLTNLDDQVKTMFSDTTNSSNRWTGTNWFDGQFIVTSNDNGVAYLGYLKQTLTTNMITVYVATANIGISSFTNAFDANTTTYTHEGTNAGGGNTAYEIDLGTNYHGFWSCKFRIGGGSGNSSFSLGNSSTRVTMSGEQANVAKRDETLVITSNSTIQVFQPLDGRYLYIATTHSVITLTYSIGDISVYAVTNAYRNMGGF